MRIAFYLNKKLIALCNEIPAEGAVVGRSREADIILSEPGITKLSRKHIKIYCSGEKISVEDLGSSNGTYLNGHLITARRRVDLMNNDIIKIGEVQILAKVNRESSAIGDEIMKTQTTGPLELSDYKFNKAIGRGLSGDVFLVRHKETKQQFVLKLPVSDFKITDKSITEFNKWMTFAKQLDHPNITESYEHGYENGTLYFIQDYCEGGSLYDFVGKYGKLLPKFALAYVIELLSALEYAHNAELTYENETIRGIIHFDLRPQTVLFKQSEHGDLTIQIADFGLFSALGYERDTDKADDVIAVVALLYFMLTGRYPGKFIHKSLEETLVPNSVEPIENLRKNIPKELSNIINLILNGMYTDKYSSEPALLKAKLQEIRDSLKTKKP